MVNTTEKTANMIFALMLMGIILVLASQVVGL